MRFGVVIVGCISSVALVASAQAEEVHLCIRGKSFEPGREFLQTRQLNLKLAGPAAGDLLLTIAGRAVREKLWPELKPDEVQVAPFDEVLCGSEPAAELTLSYSPDDLAVIQIERSRGPGDQPRLSAVARGGAGQAAPPKRPPPGTAADARRHDWLRVYFATTRQPTGAARANAAFGGQPSNNVQFGAVDVSIPADHRWAKLESPSLLRLEWDADPKRHVQLAPSVETLPAATWKAELARRAGAFDKGGVLLFVHGYNNSFAEAAQRAGQLAYGLAFPGPTVLFSWPSNGEFVAYTRDEQKALTAWRQMADVLDQLTRLGPGVPVYVVAHSMGNRVLTQGLAELLRRRPGADRAFRQVVLAWPDQRNGDERPLPGHPPRLAAGRAPTAQQG